VSSQIGRVVQSVHEVNDEIADATPEGSEKVVRIVIDVIASLLVIFHLVHVIVQFHIFGLNNRQADRHMLVGAGVSFESWVIDLLVTGCVSK